MTQPTEWQKKNILATRYHKTVSAGSPEKCGRSIERAECIDKAIYDALCICIGEQNGLLMRIVNVTATIINEEVFVTVIAEPMPHIDTMQL